MTIFNPESGQTSRAERLQTLQVAAAEIGMRLVPLEVAAEQSNAVQRDALTSFAEATDTPKWAAFKTWRRLQELYTAKVQFEQVGLITATPRTTPLFFQNAPPIPSHKPELPESWVDWRQMLTHLDSDSLSKFSVQLDNAESRFGRNPQADLLGKGNGPVMFSLIKRFVAYQQAADYNKSINS